MKQEPNTPKTAKKTSRFQGLQLVLVQSSVCVFAVLLMLLLRVIDTDTFSALSMQFQEAMTADVLVSAEQPTGSLPTSATTQTSPTNHPSAEAVVSAKTITFHAPLQNGTLTSSFGEREDPFDPNVTAVHQGMDIAAPGETPLAALADGVVREVGNEENGYGRYVIVECTDGYRYLYAHCAAISVTAGQSVRAGQSMASVGNTGRSTGNHVHIEWIAPDGTRCDPSAVVPKESYA